jgi:hypothetical protein
MADCIYHPFEAMGRVVEGDSFEEVRDAILLPNPKQEVLEWFFVLRGAKQAFGLTGDRRCEQIAEQLADWVASKICTTVKY